ncbi:lipopolysaccharide biosynthesis protein [Clostridium perfringens]|uniref:lipopolysaccharide biosynthesis protein n=1 Tax=Clostridium perfringens TaxID=1502 RepID=UPI0013793875|nr:hypothetical protein [Clostridium perfringens]
MQIIVYPVLARIFNSSSYGVLLTVMGIINTISVTVGNTLNNTRLIQNTNYEEKGFCGDFNAILLFSSIIGAILMWIIGNKMFHFSISINILMMILVLLMSAKAYFIVAFRINLNFKSNFICNLFVAIGYIVGIVIVIITRLWPLIFIVAELFGLLWIYKDTDIYKESLKRTELFKPTMSKFLILLIVTLSTNVMLYLDRMIIYPILGSESVSIYTVAVFFGKTLGIIMTPIASVLLGYFAQKDYVMNLKNFWKTNLIVIIIAIVFMLFSLIAAPIATKILYPELFEQAKPYIFYANLAAVIGVIASMAQPAILKFVPTYCQLIKELLYAVIYLGAGVYLLNKYGLMGFCIVSILANFSKLLILYLIGTIYFSNNKVDEKTN